MVTTQPGRLGPTVYLSPGAHKLEARAPGYKPFTASVIVYAGEMLNYPLPLYSEWTPEVVGQ